MNAPVVFEEFLLVLRVLLRERPRAARCDQQLVSPKSTADFVPVLKFHQGWVGVVDGVVADVLDGVAGGVIVALSGVDAMRIYRVGRDVASKHLLEIPAHTVVAPV